MTEFAFPFQIDSTGRTATVDEDDHVRQLIMQVLFTVPGERVNRPSFGSAARNLVFAPNDAQEATTVQYLMQSALQQWLSDVIRVEALQVVSEDNVMRVIVQYVDLRTQQRQTAQFQGGAQP